MKKSYANSDIVTMYNVLNNLKGRADIIVGDADIFWANCNNLEALKEKADKIQTVTTDIVNSFFTDENSHIEKNEEGEEVRILNDETKEETLHNLQIELNKINAKKVDIELESISEESVKTFVKNNEKAMSFLEMNVMRQFIEKK